MYSADAITSLRKELATVTPKYVELMLHYTRRTYRTDRGKEFATQGFLRRLGTLRRCIKNIFRYLPPELQGIPSEDDLADTTIALQAFVFNVFGCLDNLTWVWVEERDLKKPDGSPLPRNWVGIGSKCVTVRNSFSQDFRAYLAERQNWFAHLEDYRNALAHRIPLYIPPYCVKPENQARYQELERLITRDALAGNENSEREHRVELETLKFFRPWMKHSYEENSPIGTIHPQILADFNTINEFAWRMREELDRLAAP